MSDSGVKGCYLCATQRETLFPSGRARVMSCKPCAKRYKLDPAPVRPKPSRYAIGEDEPTYPGANYYP